MGTASLALLALLLALPSATYQVFDGLPLSWGPEFFVLALLVPFLLSRGLRRLYGRRVKSWTGAATGIVGALALVAIAIKVVLLLSGAHEGFLACYTSPLEPSRGGPCERSFEHPFFRFSVTRVDRAIDFSENDWDLGFLNASRFDRHYDGLAGRLRHRLPIEVTWRGDVERPEPWVARVIYVGEATLAVDPDGAAGGAAAALAPRYGAPAVAFVPIPAGRHALRIEYRYDDGSTFGGPPPDGPWATLRIERGRGAGGRAPGAPVTAARPGLAWRALAGASDAAIALLALPLLLFYAGLLWRDAWLLGLLGVMVPLIDRSDLFGLPTSLGLCLLLALIAASVLGRRWRRRLTGAYFSLLYVAFFTTLHTFHRLGVATLRETASDPLAYESEARAILETWSLEGGEPIYFMQPGFRYVRFLQRLVLGDGDGLVSIVALAALYWALCWAFARLWPRPRRTRIQAVAFAAVAVLTLALASSPPVVFFTQVSLSEHPTWIVLPLLFPLLFLSRSPRDWLRGAVLAALSAFTRLNQVPGILAAMAVFGWRAWPIRRTPVLVAFAVVLAVLPLPLAHNLYYGGRAVWGTGNQNDPMNTVIPPRDLVKVLSDAGVRARAWYQIDHIFYLHDLQDHFPRGEYVSWVAIHGIQLLWLTVGLWTLVRRAAPRMTKALLALPLAYLGVHLMFVVDFYYPRHIVAGHLAMALVTLYAVGAGFGRTPARGG